MLDVAIDAAKKGGDLAYWYFKTHPKVTYKPDNSPVTKADIEVEKLIRKIERAGLASLRIGDTFNGQRIDRNCQQGWARSRRSG